MELLRTGPEEGPVLLLAPGAAGGVDGAWYGQLCAALAGRGVATARFEFAYTLRRRAGGTAGQPRAEAVLDEYRAAVTAAGTRRPLLIGGKSFGGRVASMVADELHDAGLVDGLVCVGYPFHPPGRPEQLRTAHLERLRTSALICQGTRDPFGTQEQVAGYPLSPAIRIHWAPDGDHSLVPRKASGRTFAGNLDGAADAIAAFARALPSNSG